MSTNCAWRCSAWARRSMRSVFWPSDRPLSSKPISSRGVRGSRIRRTISGVGWALMISGRVEYASFYPSAVNGREIYPITHCEASCRRGCDLSPAGVKSALGICASPRTMAHVRFARGSDVAATATPFFSATQRQEHSMQSRRQFMFKIVPAIAVGPSRRPRLMKPTRPRWALATKPMRPRSTRPSLPSTPPARPAPTARSIRASRPMRSPIAPYSRASRLRARVGAVRGRKRPDHLRDGVVKQGRSNAPLVFCSLGLVSRVLCCGFGVAGRSQSYGLACALYSGIRLQGIIAA